MNQTIHVGAIAPYSCIVTVESFQDTEESPYWDLSTGVSAAVFEVRDENGTVRTWPAIVSAAATNSFGSEVVLTHEFVLDDVPKAGTLYVRPRLTHETHGTLYGEAFKLMVTGGFT